MEERGEVQIGVAYLGIVIVSRRMKICRIS